MNNTIGGYDVNTVWRKEENIFCVYQYISIYFSSILTQFLITSKYHVLIMYYYCLHYVCMASLIIFL